MLPMRAGAGAPDDFSGRYGMSRQPLCGPVVDLSRPFVALLGGAATMGKGVDRSWAALSAEGLDLPVANLGAPHAGPDFYLANPACLDIASQAAAVVVQLPGADALCNPFYTVHSRRNDRFLSATPALRGLFPGLEVTDIHFTRHLLQVLAEADALAHACVVRALRQTWLARMQDLLDRLPKGRTLLWWGDDMAADWAPFLVDPALAAGLCGAGAPLVTVPLSPPDDGGEALAPGLPGPAVHAAIAAALIPEIRVLSQAPRPAPLILRRATACGQVA